MMEMTINTCEVCGGLGIVQKNVPLGHPDFGKTFPCPACTTYEDQRQERIHHMSRLDTFTDKTFETFYTEVPEYTEAERARLRGVVNQVFDFLDGEMRWLVLRGVSGTGKTHLAAAIGHTFVERGIPSIFITAPDLLDHLRMTFAPHSEISYDQQFETLCKVELLILDDLGAESATPWAQEKLYQLINHRYNAAALTVFTTNALELETLGDRVASRLEDRHLSMQITLNVPDFRRGGGIVRDPAINAIADLSNYKEMRFDTFDISALSPDEVRKISRIREYADDPQGWLILLGTHGAGKTHLAASIAHHQAGISRTPPLIVSTADLLDFLRATFAPDAKVSLDSRFHAVRRAPLLILDDFRLGTATNWSRDKLFQLIDFRYLNKLPTVFVLPPQNMKTLEETHEDIFRRLTDPQISIFVELKAKPYQRRN